MSDQHARRSVQEVLVASRSNMWFNCGSVYHGDPDCFSISGGWGLS